MQRTLSLAAMALCLFLLGATTTRAATDPTPAVAPVEALFSAINADDGAKIAATYAPDAIIVDEFAPFRWSGASAGAEFWKSFGVLQKAEGLSEVRVRHGDFKFLAYDDAKASAYVVAPTTIDFTLKGKPGTETGQWAFVLTKTAPGWLISSSAWATVTN